MNIVVKTARSSGQPEKHHGQMFDEKFSHPTADQAAWMQEGWDRAVHQIRDITLPLLLNGMAIDDVVENLGIREQLRELLNQSKNQ